MCAALQRAASSREPADRRPPRRAAPAARRVRALAGEPHHESHGWPFNRRRRRRRRAHGSALRRTGHEPPADCRARPSAGEAIRLAMRQAGRLEVLGYVNGRDFARDAAIRLARPDLISSTTWTAPPDAVARLREARVAAPQATIVLLAHDLQAAWLADAMDAGADALVSKAMHPGSWGRSSARSRPAPFHRFVSPAAAAARDPRPRQAHRTRASGPAAHGRPARPTATSPVSSGSPSRR